MVRTAGPPSLPLGSGKAPEWESVQWKEGVGSRGGFRSVSQAERTTGTETQSWREGMWHLGICGNISGWLEHRMPDREWHKMRRERQTGSRSSKACLPCKDFNYLGVSGSLLKSSKQKMITKIWWDGRWVGDGLQPAERLGWKSSQDQMVAQSRVPRVGWRGKWLLYCVSCSLFWPCPAQERAEDGAPAPKALTL